MLQLTPLIKYAKGIEKQRKRRWEKSILYVASLSWNFVQLHSLIKECFL